MLYYCEDCGTVKFIAEPLKPNEEFKVRHCDSCSSRSKKGTTTFLPVETTNADLQSTIRFDL